MSINKRETIEKTGNGSENKQELRAKINRS
jgi:hypothetical protein